MAYTQRGTGVGDGVCENRSHAAAGCEDNSVGCWGGGKLNFGKLNRLEDNALASRKCSLATGTVLLVVAYAVKAKAHKVSTAYMAHYALPCLSTSPGVVPTEDSCK